MKTDSTIKTDDDLLELISDICDDDDLAFDARVQVQKYLQRCRQEVLNEFEDFMWTDTNSGESNVYFEEAFTKHIDMVYNKFRGETLN